MKINRLFPVVLMLLLSIGFNSCNKDELIDDGGKRDYVEICKNVADIDYAIVDYYKKCASIDELKQYADEIRALKGVEDVYFNETTTMFVKIKDFRTISYSYYPKPDKEAYNVMQQQMIKRTKSYTNSQGNEKQYSNQGRANMKILIVNQQSWEEDRTLQNQTIVPGIEERFMKAGFQKPIIENSPNAEFFRNGIFDCDYLMILTHGHYDQTQRLHWLATSELVPRDSNGKIKTSFLEKFQNYAEDEYTLDLYADDKNVVIVSEKFIESSTNQFNHPGKAIVFNTACQSMKGPNPNGNDSINESLAIAFIHKGAGAYLGYDETNGIGDFGGFEFWERLLSGMSIKSAHEDLSMRTRHDHCSEKKHWYSQTRWWWADLELFTVYLEDQTINQPEIACIDSSNDDGLQIDLYARTFFEHCTTTYYDESDQTGANLRFDSYSELLPFKYGFELSESEDFSNVIPLGEKRIGDEGCNWDQNYNKLDDHYYMLAMTQSLKYNASESNSKIKPETTYWARAYVYDGSGYNYSEPVTFTTKAYSRIDHVIPPDIRDQMDPYITIYDGNNPPNIEGEFIISPSELTYNSVGDYPVGHVFADTYIKFLNQDMHANTLDYREKQSSSSQTGEGAFISGDGNNFSVFFNTDGIGHYSEYDINYKTALIISGTKTSDGISNLQYAFVMVDKSDDPKPYIIPVGAFRVIKDGDGFSPTTSWASFLRRMQQRSQQQKPSYLEWRR